MRERREKRTNIPPTGETDGQTQAGRTGWKGEKETAGRGGEEDCGPMTDALVYSIESDRQTHFDLNTAALLHAHPRRLRLPPSLPPSLLLRLFPLHHPNAHLAAQPLPPILEMWKKDGGIGGALHRKTCRFHHVQCVH
mmetsp:Transcript_45799/g.90194  ORF Transcript_45799/g.90194 Transcript_45799/m.90194 type:complete len:138 (-) Transcript_45799:240-653(-)